MKSPSTSSEQNPRSRPVPEPSPEASLEQLEQEINYLAGFINAATCRFLLLVAEFDRREGWHGVGMISCAHWLNWRCGIGLAAAREKVRVARALGELDLIRSSFEKGEISYSKVRAMTRVATPENEAVLMQVARYGTAHHVETTVRKYRRACELQVLDKARSQYEGRGLTYLHEEDDSIVIRVKLPPEQGEVVLSALRAMADRLWQDRHVSAETSSSDTGRVSAGTFGSVTGGAAAETSSSDTGGVSSETSYSDSGNVSAETSQVASREESTPSQRHADALVAIAEDSLARERLDGESSSHNTGDRYVVTVHVNEDTLSSGREGRCELGAGPALAVETARRVACDAGIVRIEENGEGNTLNVGRKTRAIPPAMRRALSNRDKGCRFPGCTRTRFTDGHHIRHWADGGETCLDNLVLLCRHHHRLVHEGCFNVHVDGAGQLRFTTPAGAVLPAAPSQDVESAPLEMQMEAFQRKRGITIDPDTADSGWCGESIDYHHTAWLMAMREAEDCGWDR